MQPVFDALADDELLSKCFHGDTQNPNETFNKIVWTRFPKFIYVSRSIIQLGVNSAVLHIMKKHVVLVMYFYILKLIMVIIWKKR